MRQMNLIALLSAMFVFFSCNSQKKAYKDLGDGLFADIETTKGHIVVKLNYKEVPTTVANFVTLAEGKNNFVKVEYKGKPFYNGTIFHRVIDGFMIQGGDPTGTGMGDPGYRFEDEFVPSLKHSKKGILSMANSGPNTNGSQFFITEVATDWLNFRHTIFGQVIQGEDVISKITSVKTGAQDRPVDPVVIKKVEIIRVGKDAQKWDAPKVFDAFMKEQNAKAQKLESQKEKNLAVMAEQEAKAVAQPSGIKILKLKEGNGVKPQIGSDVLVNYAGFLRATGDLFDTNIAEIAKENDAYDAARAADPQYGYIPYAWKYSPEVGLIAGFKEALLSMKVGDRIRVFIPSALAYGKQGFGNGVIPPDADLMFEIEIVDAQVTDAAK